eukprot:TRINITY_DN11335_c0_g1_i1.p1 TRINITY_DN11335_c0_g1~~TRINITY_DN11335_c0_g1_i1.p1  ORF type:complete len:418 (+),score=77.90 TRINITY_DN11335_c0_g1_i1:991-2244(+)
MTSVRARNKGLGLRLDVPPKLGARPLPMPPMEPGNLNGTGNGNGMVNSNGMVNDNGMINGYGMMNGNGMSLPPPQAVNSMGNLNGRPQPMALPLPPRGSAMPPQQLGGNQISSGSSMGGQSRGMIAYEDLEINQKEPLGLGSGGTVYRVRHRETGKEYALKKIRHLDEHTRKNILSETLILRESQCEHIVQCYAIFERMGDISFVLELMDAGTLADVGKRWGGPIPEPYLAEVTRQVLMGLYYLHKKKHVAHRDIKPSNLLINSQGQVKIADFGVSIKLDNTLAECKSFVGTQAYLSPERIAPQSEGHYNGFASDVWALGLSLLELSLGYYPLLPKGEAPIFVNLMNGIVYEPACGPPANCSDEFRHFIELCLQKDPKKRPDVLTLMNHSFPAMHDEAQWTDLRVLLHPNQQNQRGA